MTRERKAEPDFTWRFHGTAVLALGVLGVGAYYVVMALRDPGAVEGRLVASGTAQGDFEIAEAHCSAGIRRVRRDGDFEGVRIEGETGGGLRIVKSASGFQVALELPGTCNDGAGCTTIPLDASRCTKLLVSAAPTNRTFNKVKVWSGSLTLDCRLEPGTVTGQISFPECI